MQRAAGGTGYRLLWGHAVASAWPNQRFPTDLLSNLGHGHGGAPPGGWGMGYGYGYGLACIRFGELQKNAVMETVTRHPPYFLTLFVFTVLTVVFLSERHMININITILVRYPTFVFINFPLD